MDRHAFLGLQDWLVELEDASWPPQAGGGKVEVILSDAVARLVFDGAVPTTISFATAGGAEAHGGAEPLGADSFRCDMALALHEGRPAECIIRLDARNYVLLHGRITEMRLPRPGTMEDPFAALSFGGATKLQLGLPGARFPAGAHAKAPAAERVLLHAGRRMREALSGASANQGEPKTPPPPARGPGPLGGALQGSSSSLWAGEGGPDSLPNSSGPSSCSADPAGSSCGSSATVCSPGAAGNHAALVTKRSAEAFLACAEQAAAPPVPAAPAVAAAVAAGVPLGSAADRRWHDPEVLRLLGAAAAHYERSFAPAAEAGAAEERLAAKRRAIGEGGGGAEKDADAALRYLRMEARLRYLPRRAGAVGGGVDRG